MYRRVAVSFGAVLVGLAVLAPAARASQGETASQGATQRFVHAAVRGGNPQGVPGAAGNAGRCQDLVERHQLPRRPGHATGP